MASLSELQSRLEALKKAYHSGVLMVRHGETSTQFRSQNEMLNIIHKIEDEIRGLDGTRQPKRVRYITQKNKGF